MLLDTYYKIIAALIIFAITLLGGAFPIFLPVNQRAKKMLIYGGAFSGGVFLGIGLIHLLPESQKAFQSVSVSHYPYMFLVCALTILFLRFLEDGTVKLLQHYHDTKETFTTYLLTILLSVHSLVEGAALGVEQALAGVFIIFIAIFSHKSAESFSLGVSMRRSVLSVRTMVQLLVLFSLMTPIGILFGSVLSRLLAAHSGCLANAIFDAIAAGTFIYIATSHSLSCACSCHDEHDGTSYFLQILFFIAGLLLMATMASLL